MYFKSGGRPGQVEKCKSGANDKYSKGRLLKVLKQNGARLGEGKEACSAIANFWRAILGNFECCRYAWRNLSRGVRRVQAGGNQALSARHRRLSGAMGQSRR